MPYIFYQRSILHTANKTERITHIYIGAQLTVLMLAQEVRKSANRILKKSIQVARECIDFL